MRLFLALSILFSSPLYSGKLSDWMKETLDYSLTLKDITIPGAHDATIYKCFDCTIGANVRNTQTQYLPIEQLLDSGIRYFDVRPIYDGSAFYTGHFTRYDKRPSFGCKGDSLERVLRKVQKFSVAHNEVVILHLSHYSNRNWKNMPGYLDSLFALLEKNLSGVLLKVNDDARIADLPLSLLKGKVILLFSDYKEQKISDPARGFFSAGKDLAMFDRYSNTTDVEFMMDDQLKKFSAWKAKEKKHREEIFVMPWTLTHNAKAARRCSRFKLPWRKGVSIIEYAHGAKKLMAEKFKDWVYRRVIERNQKPNIINVDIADGTVTRLCIELNKL